MKAKEVKEENERLNEAKGELRSFYDFGRFDLNYVADAFVFSKADSGPGDSSNKVMVTTPGTRARATSQKRV